ncbi:MAG: hypothetical protein HN580_19980 [Deltaproteobacteria bacterium]|jgi:hypothetical protein|nr:hypothetical protein [Deltaproteobacteria bacterium]MBT4641419.1 hypothetical protein [Deltaproteobacteria bacterium]MBT6502400.1 hypothetical protein [Deltaproteobacteria bacterium]MBT6612523.1 hypothetical protein [Deltaproteobacteria bacterium]MBT7152951.1 hypothetical protein [Deltaproteobacteria bacterium]
MVASVRIKSYFKEQIQKGHLSKRDLLKVQVQDLREIKALRDIDEKSATETLQIIKQMVNPDLINGELQQLMNDQGSPLADKVSEILKGYE